MSDLTPKEDSAFGVSFAYERLDVYKVSIELVEYVHEILMHVDKSGAHLVDQLRRASSSISLNIAEGAQRMTRPDKARFYSMASGSAAECAAALEILHRTKLVKLEEYSKATTLARRVSKMLFALIKSVR